MKINFKHVIKTLICSISVVMSGGINTGCSCNNSKLQIIHQIEGSTLTPLKDNPGPEITSDLRDGLVTHENVYLSYGTDYIYKVNEIDFISKQLQTDVYAKNLAKSFTGEVYLSTSSAGEIYDITDIKNPVLIATVPNCDFLYVDHAKIMYVVEAGNYTVYKIDLNASVDGEYPVVKYIDLGEEYIDELIILSDDSILLYDAFRGVLYKLGTADPEGIYNIVPFYDFYAKEDFPLGTKSVFKVVQDKHDNLYFALDNGTLMKFVPQSTATTLLMRFVDDIFAVVVYKEDDLMVAVSKPEGFIAYYNDQVDTTWYKLIETNLCIQMFAIVELFFLPENNNIYLKFCETPTIYRFTLDF